MSWISYLIHVTSLAKYQYECEIFDKINNEEKMVIFILHCIESLHIIGQLIKIALIFYMLYTKYCLQSQLCMPTGILLVLIKSDLVVSLSGGWNCFWDLRFTSNLRKKCLRFEILNLTEIWDFSLSHWELRFQKNDLRSEILDEIHQTSEIFAVFSKKNWRHFSDYILWLLQNFPTVWFLVIL